MQDIYLWKPLNSMVLVHHLLPQNLNSLVWKFTYH